MDTIENFLAQYPATISTIAAGATVAAVIVALYLARLRSRSRLRVFADIGHYISPEAQERSPTIDLKEHPLVITVTIINVGPIAVSISYWGSFVWSVPGGKQVATQNPEEPDFRNQPIELLPGRSATIMLSRDLHGHRTTMKELAEKSWLGAWSLRFPRLIVRTEIGDEFLAKLGESLRKDTRG